MVVDIVNVRNGGTQLNDDVVTNDLFGGDRRIGRNLSQHRVEFALDNRRHNGRVDAVGIVVVAGVVTHDGKSCALFISKKIEKKNERNKRKMRCRNIKNIVRRLEGFWWSVFGGDAAAV